MENLDRGIVAVQTESGVFVSWRFLPTDSSHAVFTVLRDGKPVAKVGSDSGTNYLDGSGTKLSKYRICSSDTAGKESKRAGKVSPGGKSSQMDKTAHTDMVSPVSAEAAVWSKGYLPVRLNRPLDQSLPDGSRCSFFPNDMSAGDLDGDGQYELVVKWQPDNAKDSSQNGYTGATILDAYRLDGTLLWRVNLGINIRSGAHYSPFLVGDFDGDGKAELICQTADGTIDGTGTAIGDARADFRSGNGRILSGTEYLSVFEGQTGRVIQTIDYPAPRSVLPITRNGWGDDYGNRCDRFLACAAYLDGRHPSAVFCRGYYTAAYVAAFDFDGKRLRQRWLHKSETPGEGLYGEGNHNIAVGDLDNDGCDEIVYGSAALDNDGTVLYRTGFGHGDALHLFGAPLLDNNGQTVDGKPRLLLWDIHEDKKSPYGAELRSPEGTVLWGQPGGRDIGRGLAADIDPRYPGVECWSAAEKGVFSQTGKKISDNRPSFNFRIYWDGDLQDELLDGTVIDKWTGDGTERLAAFHEIGNASSVNGTKKNPCLQADILGDWREEVILYNKNAPDQINIYTTTIPSPYRIDCLMTDPLYRLGIVWQNAAYNQPPHAFRLKVRNP